MINGINFLEYSNHKDYIEAISNHAFFKEWRDEAIKEKSVINAVELA
jgi:hypothetical protein